MATIALDGRDAVVRLTPLEKLGALRGDVRVPLAAIRAARVVSRPLAEVRGLRAPGTAVPGLVAVGTWRRRRRAKEFVAVHRTQPGIVVDLDPAQARFGRLVVSLSEPEEARRLLATG